MKKQITIELKPEQLNDDGLIKKIAVRECHIRESELTAVEYVRRSLDSRRSKPRFVLLLNVYSGESPAVSAPVSEAYRQADGRKKVIIAGAGPAGYFAALELLEYGIQPVIFERGRDVRARRFDLREIMQRGYVNPNSNYSFGEGGAGAYSDGKLYTRSNKRGDIGKVLKILVEHGARPDIMIDAHPHIGSNKLPGIIANIRQTILNYGGEVHFDSTVTDIIIRNGKAAGVIVNDTAEVTGDAVIIATGHSARDVFHLLNKKKIFIEAKPFAVGFRIEHTQQLINEIQYGRGYSRELPPASYNIAVQANERGVFSFCMCPGGLIVPSVTGGNELVVNGMSMSCRNSVYANSGIVTTVDEKDFAKFSKSGALAGLMFQESLERKFYTGNAENPLKAPAQRLVDYINGKRSSGLNKTSYIPGLVSMDLAELLPADISVSLKRAMKGFSSKMNGFVTNEANLIGLESRTSSPVRITRNRETLNHVEIGNLYPCGEGAGYAGGIVSSAIDGQNCSKAIARNL